PGDGQAEGHRATTGPPVMNALIPPEQIRIVAPQPPRLRLRAARSRLRNLGRLREAQQLEHRASLLESASSPTPLDWVSADQVLLDRFRAEPYAYNITSAYDRKFGRNYPLYGSEAELSLLRAPSRLLCQTNTYAQGLIEGLTSYVIGEGYTYRAAARKGQEP